MRGIVFAILGVCAAATLGSAASASPHFPTGAAALETQLLASQSADARAFIKDEAQREAAVRVFSEETPRNAVRKYGATGPDVSKMAFLVLMEASRVSDANVADLVNGVQSDAASRQDIREARATSNIIAGAQQSQLSNGEMTAEQSQGHAFVSLLPEDKYNNPIARAKRPQEIPMLTMNLQDAMDRQNQIEDILPDAMKRAAQAS